MITRRYFGAWISIFVLAGCSDQTVATEDQIRSEKIRTEVTRERQVMERSEQQRFSLSQQGQGCEGRILRGEELRRAVSGKFDPGLAFPSQRFTYYRSGEFRKDRHNSGAITGNYRIEKDQLCHYFDWGSTGEMKYCTRLIEKNDNIIMEEGLDDRNPNILRLSCREKRLEDNEDGK